MKTDYQNTSMLDIVFEHRNKAYGAYALRRDYNKSLLKAVGITWMTVILFLAGNFVIGKLSAKPVFAEKHVVAEPTDIDLPPKVEEDKKIEEKKPIKEEPKGKPTIENVTKNVVKDDQAHVDSLPPTELLNKVDAGLTTNLNIVPNGVGVENGKGNEQGEEEVQPKKPVRDFEEVAEVMPSFPGGEAALMAYLLDHTDYPIMEQENGIEGKAIVKFIVNEDGSISSPSLIRNDSPGFGKEALKVLKDMPKFNPGKQQGKAVRVQFVLPFKWKLNN